MEVLTKHPKNLLIAGASRVGPDVLYGFLAVFTLTYVTQRLGLSRSIALTAVLIGAGVHIVSVPLFAILSDKIGRRPVYALGALGGAAWMVAIFRLLDSGEPVLIVLAVAVGMVFQASMYGPQGAFITEQFTTRVRYTGSSLAYTFAGVVGGAFAPLIFTTLLQSTSGTLPLIAYVWAALAITLVALAAAKETAGSRID